MRRLVLVVALVGLVAAGCGSSGSASGTAKYCDVARNIAHDIPLSANTDYRALFAQFDKSVRPYLAAVPPEIKDDANTFVEAVRKLESGLRAVNFDIFKLTPADAAALQASVSDPKYGAASSRLNAYNLKNCAITTPTTPTTPTT